MNLYFLVEGKRTERKVYPMWLPILRPELAKVDHVLDVENNNYYLISGEGYPSLLNHLEHAIDEVNEIDKFDYLILCLDSEEVSLQTRKEEILKYITQKHIKLKRTELVIIIQHPCFETWFLGNRKIFKRYPQSQTLNQYINFYDVREKDPELMPCFQENTRAQFHHSYLREIFNERNIVYTKQKPEIVGEETFLNELINRSTETSHISSFKNFIDFIKS